MTEFSGESSGRSKPQLSTNILWSSQKRLNLLFFGSISLNNSGSIASTRDYSLCICRTFTIKVGIATNSSGVFSQKTESVMALRSGFDCLDQFIKENGKKIEKNNLRI